MKIKLISPKMSLRPMDSEFKRRMSPSLGLLTVAALTPQENEVYIGDENVDNINLDDSPDVVGITVNVDTATRAYQIAQRYREKGIAVILGGIHASANPQEASLHADAVCVGEATVVWKEILMDLKNNCLRKIYQRQDKGKTYDLPVPRWDLIDKSKYLFTNVIATSRGCPFRCTFCYNSCDYAGHNFRHRTIDNIMGEIKALNAKHIMFIDDNLIGDIEWCAMLIQELKSLRISWQGAVSVNIGVYPSLLDSMKESGCKSLFIGFETINHDSLQNAGKYQNKVHDYEKTIREIHARGIGVNASIVFGFDEDGPGVFKSTVNWLIHHKIETMTAHILTPYPGTKLYRQLNQEGRITDFNGNHYNTAHVVYRPRHINGTELYQGYLWSYREFYSLKNIFKRMPATPKEWLPFLLFNLGYRRGGKIMSFLATRLGLMNKWASTALRWAYATRKSNKS